MIPR
jgi:hypothetical protein